MKHTIIPSCPIGLAVLFSLLQAIPGFPMVAGQELQRGPNVEQVVDEQMTKILEEILEGQNLPALFAAKYTEGRVIRFEIRSKKETAVVVALAKIKMDH